jgi:predicted Fe-Mo cluster-binding NifX family protein
MTKIETVFTVPVVNENGMDSLVSPHYARAPMHAIVNAADGSVTFAPSNEGNNGKARIPFAAFEERGASAVVCRQIGRHACDLLKEQGLSVFVTKGLNLREILAEMNAGQLSAPTDEILDHEGAMRCRKESEENEDHGVKEACSKDGTCCGEQAESGHGENREKCHHHHAHGCCHGTHHPGHGCCRHHE